MGLTIITFIGSVFSPYYALARKFQSAPDPENFVAMNVVLYLPRGRRWSMTERGRASLERSPDQIRIGPSGARWTGSCLELDVEEVTVPIPRRLQGRIRVYPDMLSTHSFNLDPENRHQWLPIAPKCRVEVDFEHPDLSWRGCGYLDTNQGSEPLEDAFSDWWWSRTHSSNGTHIRYETVERNGNSNALSIRFHNRLHGGFETLPAGEDAALRRTGWLIKRPTRGRGTVTVKRTLEDTPFYARSLLTDSSDNENALVVHESLNLSRFKSPIIQSFLPYRMPRRSLF
jgi:carotenoid 1,2-hydratase